ATLLITWERVDPPGQARRAGPLARAQRPMAAVAAPRPWSPTRMDALRATRRRPSSEPPPPDSWAARFLRHRQASDCSDGRAAARSPPSVRSEERRVGK